MKTKITQKIDDYQIIIGMGEAQIDPVLTEPIAIDNLKNTDEYKSVENKKKELQPLSINAAQSFKNAKQSKTISEKNKFIADYQRANEEIKGIEEQLKELFIPLVEKRTELILKHAVYFQPKEGEFIIDEKEFEGTEKAMQKATENNKLLDINLKEISDYRGKIVWNNSTGKWVKRNIVKIGDDPKSGEILSENLTAIQQKEISDQLDIERILLLSKAEKDIEKNIKIQQAASQAATMRSELEIQGVKDALAKAQDWYNSEVVRIEALYK